MQTNEPIFVAISDIHFNVNNLKLATQALQAAINKAYELQIPLIIAGDLHDTKAIIRGEVANRLIEIFQETTVHTYILVGNHDLLNEKGDEDGLRYLKSENVTVISCPTDLRFLYQYIHFIPYQNTVQKFKAALSNVLKGSIVVCHQGVQGAYLGDYVQDKTSIAKEELEGYKIISGHYHRHQSVGPLTYIGSPFTHTFGEAGDGDKGFLIVNSDGSFTREILPLRRHVKLDLEVDEMGLWIPESLKYLSDTLLWVKVTGPQSQLNKINKEELGKQLLGHSNFKFDLIPITGTQVEEVSANVKSLTAHEMLDKMIEGMPESPECILYLQSLWKELIV